jgi:hypothetical protein
VSYRVKLYAFDEASEQDKRDAEDRFRQALDETLGDASLVLPVYAAYQRIIATYGETPDPDLLSTSEAELLDQWQAAEAAALTAALGPSRYMGDAEFDISR